jgi:hypothetical protein
MIQRRALAWALSVAVHRQRCTTRRFPPRRNRAWPTHTPRHASIVDARIVVRPGKVIESGSIEMRDGLIVDVRAVVARHPARWSSTPAARPSFRPSSMSTAATVSTPGALPRTAAGQRQCGGPRRGPFAGMRGGPESAPSAPSAQHWNDRVCPERDVSTALALDARARQDPAPYSASPRAAAPGTGVLRGQSALLSLRDGPTPQQNLLAPRVAQNAAFEADFSFGGVYPGSKMGAIALIRQALYDAAGSANSRAGRTSTAASAPKRMPRWMRWSRCWPGSRHGVRCRRRTGRGARRAHRREFDLTRAWVLGTGTEYRVLDQIPQDVDLILPLNFPKPRRWTIRKRRSNSAWRSSSTGASRRRTRRAWRPAGASSRSR